MMFLGIVLIVVAILIVCFFPFLIGKSNWVSADEALGIGMAYAFAFLFATFGAIIVALELFD